MIASNCIHLFAKLVGVPKIAVFVLCLITHTFLIFFSDPKVAINPLAWHGDVVTVAVIGSFAIAILLIAIILACWWSKSKYRQAQRLERRNSIRQSLHSLRSVGVTPSGFSDLSYRRKATQLVSVFSVSL